MEEKLIKVLIIEDNLEDFRIIEEMLKEVQNPMFELYLHKRLDDGIKALVNDEFDILLLDLNLPDSAGLDTFASVYDQAPEIPVVILTGFDDEELGIRAVREGAQDYLIKGQVNSLLLSRSITYAIERKSIEDELIRHRYYLNELVEQRTEELENVNLNLQEEIQEKEILIEEIYRRIQFTLKLISGIIGIDPSLIEEDIYNLNIKNQTRVNAISLLDDILEQSEDFAMINFKRYTEELLNYLFEIYAVNNKIIKVNLDMHSVLMDINTAIPLGLILNELISDKLNNNSTVIDIGLKLENDDLFKLSLNYDGILDKDDTELKTPELRFIRTILEQLGGSVDFSGKEKIIISLNETRI